MGNDRTVQAELLRLCLSVVSREKSAKAAFESIKQMMDANPSLPSLLLDVLVVAESELAQSKVEGASVEFLSFVSLIVDNIIPDDILRIELEALEASLPVNKQQIVRLKTRLFFKQSKYNLLREESEGYSKLIVELIDTPCKLTAPNAVTRILSLIGQFNLDPNRVVDVVLECFEQSVRKADLFVSIIKQLNFSREYICNILGHSFSFYQKADSETPESLYRVAAVLVKEGVIELKAILAYLEPKGGSSKLMDAHKARAELSKRRAKKAETISTASLPIDSSSNRFNNDSTDATNIVGVPLATIAAIQENDDAKLGAELSEELVLGKHQKMGLALALLEEGCWNLAKIILDMLPEYFVVQASRRACYAIADLIEASLNDFYHEKCQAMSLRRPTPSRVPEIGKVVDWPSLSSMVLPVLAYLGPRIAYRSSTTIKLLRLITVFFQEKNQAASETHETLAKEFIDVVDETLVPALSLSEGNCTLSEELWALLQNFPYTLRYRMYFRWANDHNARHPELQIQRGKTLGRTRYVMKRLSKETVRLMGRQIGKLCHIYPTVVFEYLLEQMQTFDNFIGPVVESIRFLSPLEFDIFSYCIINSLAEPSKQQLKASDGSLSPWLQSLATLVGSVFKKYNIELTGILQYIANQLKNGKSYDLLVLREIIQNMAGIEATANATQEHLDALSGGEVLRQEAGSFSVVRNRRAVARLREALQKDDLAVGMSILIAQQRQAVVFIDSKSLPLKLAGQMTDNCQDTLMQFGSFLHTHLKSDEYSKKIPLAPSLLSEFHLRPDATFFLTRSVYMNQVYADFDKTKKAMKIDGEKTKLDSTKKLIFFKSSFASMLKDLTDTVVPLLPSHICGDMSPKLFVVFWLLTLHDIEVPTASYEKEIEKVKKSLEAAEQGSSKRQKEEERLKNLLTKLKDELKKQTEHVERVRFVLKDCADELFEAGRSQQMLAFLQSCIIPRACFSELDALFCARFVETFHTQRSQYFQTLVFLDKIFSDILPFIIGLTEIEAHAIGRFFSRVLSMAQRWHADKAVFEAECENSPGSSSRVRLENTTIKFLSFDDFCVLCLKWQAKLCRFFSNILITPNADYVVARNCLIVMMKMLPCFPLVRPRVEEIEKAVTTIRDAEKGKRDDLSVLAASYAAQMRLRKVRIYEQHEFTRKDPPPAPPPAPVTPQNGDAKGIKRPGAGDNAANGDAQPKKRLRTDRKDAKEPATTEKTDTSESPAVKKIEKPLKKEKSTNVEKAENNSTLAKDEKTPKRAEEPKKEKVEEKPLAERKPEKRVDDKKLKEEPKSEKRLKPREKRKESAIEDGEVPPSPPPPRRISTSKSPSHKKVEESPRANGAGSAKTKENTRETKESQREAKDLQKDSKREKVHDNGRDSSKEHDKDSHHAPSTQVSSRSSRDEKRKSETKKRQDESNGDTREAANPRKDRDEPEKPLKKERDKDATMAHRLTKVIRGPASPPSAHTLHRRGERSPPREHPHRSSKRSGRY